MHRLNVIKSPQASDRDRLIVIVILLGAQDQKVYTGLFDGHKGTISASFEEEKDAIRAGKVITETTGLNCELERW